MKSNEYAVMKSQGSIHGIRKIFDYGWFPHSKYKMLEYNFELECFDRNFLENEDVIQK